MDVNVLWLGAIEKQQAGKTASGKYRARIMVDRKEIRLGTFETLKEAAIARKNGETKYFGVFSRNHN